jgi:anaerobic magnesium-protoporphyrin IX monomethyl ester cyclase
MRVLLFFPPQCRPLHPPLALPIVKAELKRRGHICKVVDLNIRFYQYILNPKTLSDIRDKLRIRIEDTDNKIDLDSKESIQFYRMATALIRSQYLIDNVKKAISIFQSDDAYDYGYFLWARKILEESIDLYGSAFGYTDIGFSQLRMRYGTASPSEIWHATEDKQENPFIDILSIWSDEEIQEFRPDLIGISFMLDEQIIPGFTLARYLKSHYNIPIMAGGVMVTRLRNKIPQEQLFNSIFDKFLPYESETEFGILIDQMDGKMPSPPVEYTEICPDFDDLPLKDYLLPTLILPFLSSRGCSYGKCRYCSHYQTYGRYVYGDPKSTAKHLKTLYEKYNCRHFYFVDEALEPRFGLELARSLEFYNLDIRWMVFARIHKGWTPEIIRSIAKAGCRRLILGLDSATDRVQKLMDKNTDIPHAEDVLKWCAQEGIATQVNFIIGYPGEEESEARETTRFIERNRLSLNTVGSSIAMTNFLLVEEAAWDKMSVIPMRDPEKTFAIYHAFMPKSGMTMQKAKVLGQELQSEADQLIKGSSRFPIMREMAFLYKDRFTNSTPPKSRYVVPSPLVTHWYNHDLRSLYEKIELAKKNLIEKPNEYKSIWWRLSNESKIESISDSHLHGYQLKDHYTENTYELSIVDAFRFI